MVDIVIVNWNSGDYLQACIQSIVGNENQKYISNIFIIDNASTDHSLERITVTGEITIVNNPSNVGFAKACNQGFRLCVSKYLLLLNPDARLLGSTLSNCISFMNKNQFDILGCQLLNDDGDVMPSCSRFPTPLRYFFDAVGLSKLAPKLFTPAVLMTDWDHKSSRVVDQVMGAFMFMRKDIFKKTGYFDERFFVYYEELDFSKRLHDFGGTSFFNNEIKAYHSGEGTTKSIKSYRLFLNLNSRLKYARKHFSYASYLFVKFCTYIIEPVSRSFLLLIQGNAGEIKNVWRGYSLLLNENKIKATDSLS